MNNDPSSLHAGHRQRMRDRYYRTGLTGFQPHEILEMILYSAIPKKDVNPLAHLLIDRFGSLDGVLSAPREELLSVPGVGPRTCDLLCAVDEMCRFYMENRFSDRPRLAAMSQAVQYALPLFSEGMKREAVLIMQDASGSLITAQCYQTPLNDPACIREILSLALMLNTHSIILIIRRPGAARRPSQTEINSLSKLMLALSGAEIYLFDCLILCGEKMFSLRLEGMLQDREKTLRDTMPNSANWYDALAERRPSDGWFYIHDLP